MARKEPASHRLRISSALRKQVEQFLEAANEYPPTTGEVVRRALADKVRQAEPGRFHRFDDWEVLRAVANAHSSSFVSAPAQDGVVPKAGDTSAQSLSVPPKAALVVLGCFFAVIGAARGGQALTLVASSSDLGTYAAAAGVEALALFGWLLVSASVQSPSNRMVRVLHGLLFAGAIILLALWGR